MPEHSKQHDLEPGYYWWKYARHHHVTMVQIDAYGDLYFIGGDIPEPPSEVAYMLKRGDRFHRVYPPDGWGDDS